MPIEVIRHWRRHRFVGHSQPLTLSPIERPINGTPSTQSHDRGDQSFGNTSQYEDSFEPAFDLGIRFDSE